MTWPSTAHYELTFAGESYAIECFADDFMERRLRRGRPYEHRELADLHASLAPGGMVVDVGANIGNHALAFSRMGFERLTAYEMMPETRALLERNLASSCRIHYRVVCAAVTDSERRDLRLKRYWKNVGSTAIAPRGPLFGGVKVTLDEEGLSGVTFVKIDVEGHEAAVLAGGAAMLAAQRPVLMVEIWKQHMGDVLPILAKLGYAPGVRMRGEFGDNYLFVHPQGRQLRSPILPRGRR